MVKYYYLQWAYVVKQKKCKKNRFSLKYVITLLSIISGGIKGIFVPQQNAFNMNQDAFGLVKE